MNSVRGRLDMKKYQVLLYEDMHEEGKTILREKAEIFFAERFDESYLANQVKEVDGIIIRANGKVTRKIMESAPKLKVIGRHGVGMENIDLEAAMERGIWVVNTPDANDISVAEHFFGLALTLSKMLKKADIALREGRWETRYEYIGRELHGKTLGILGFGRIGRTVGRIGHRGFDMKVLYYDAVQFEEAEKEIKAERVSLEELLTRSDYISINLPMLPATKGY
jgi:D-3-phosphoglycerate dehydrogenase